jgi:hypothetical protein
MRSTAIGLVLSLAVSATAFAAGPQDKMYAAPNKLPQQLGYGCAIGGTTGAALSILGTVGITIVPATAIGCGVGATAAPAAANLYERYRLDAAIFVNQAVRPLTNRALDYVESWLDPTE